MLDASLAADALTSGSVMDLGSIVDQDNMAAKNMVPNVEDENEKKIKEGMKLNSDIYA